MRAFDDSCPTLFLEQYLETSCFAFSTFLTFCFVLFVCLFGFFGLPVTAKRLAGDEVANIFQRYYAIETGPSDFHKMTATVTKMKFESRIVHYRN